MADGELEVIEQFHGILACSTLGGWLFKTERSSSRTKVSACDCRRLRFAKFLRLLPAKARAAWPAPSLPIHATIPGLSS